MSLAAILVLGFLLGMRHATDADHIVAVSTIVSREQTLRAAAPIGALWGLGHTLTVLLVGGAIVLFGIVIPARVGLGLEFAVGVMLIVLGSMNVGGAMRDRGAVDGTQRQRRKGSAASDAARSLRPLVVGLVHGLAGSAAVALIVLGTIRDALLGMVYLAVFGLGTIAGMALVTTALAVPIAAAAQRFERAHRALSVVTGIGSIAFGTVLVYEIGSKGLFSGDALWTPG